MDQLRFSVVVRSFDDQRVGRAGSQVGGEVPILSGLCKFCHLGSAELLAVLSYRFLQSQAAALDLDVFDHVGRVDIDLDRLHVRAGNLIDERRIVGALGYIVGSIGICADFNERCGDVVVGNSPGHAREVER